MNPRPKPRRPRRPTRADMEAELKGLRAQLDDHRGRMEEQALRQAQREIEASREHYAELYDFAPVGRLTLDTSGLVRALNLTAADLLGRRRDHVVGHPFQVMIAPRDRRRFLSHLSRLRRGQHHASVELELDRPGRLPVAVQMVTVGQGTNSPRLMEYQAALVDITERKRAEARTMALAKLGLSLNTAADPAAAARTIADIALELCGWDACFLQVHDQATDTVTDLVNMDTINGKRVPVPPMPEGRTPSPLMRRVMQDSPQLILRRSAEDPGPLTLRFGDTSRPSLSLMFVPLRWESRSMGVLSVQSYERNAYTPQDLAALEALADQAAGALARLQARDALQQINEQLEQRVAARTAELQHYRDHLEELVQQRTSELEATNEKLRLEILSRQVAEQALLSMAEDLKRSNQELEQFAYVASHDLQEPLRAVGGYVRLLELRFPDLLDAKAREYIAGAAEGAIRMEQQLSDLLALSRVGTQGLALGRANLSAPLNAALRNLQFTVRAASATVIHDPLPTLVVDESQITQVFQNLIANALKFHGAPPPEIHVGARAENRRWVIWVKDNGIGMEPQYFERIFQVFQRLHTRKKYPGTGIGLSICKKIVERHGGRIWVESQPGEGSTFFFSLPQPPAAAEQRTSNIQHPTPNIQ